MIDTVLSGVAGGSSATSDEVDGVYMLQQGQTINRLAMQVKAVTGTGDFTATLQMKIGSGDFESAGITRTQAQEDTIFFANPIAGGSYRIQLTSKDVAADTVKVLLAW